jgi:hypothetical protein
VKFFYLLAHLDSSAKFGGSASGPAGSHRAETCPAFRSNPPWIRRVQWVTPIAETEAAAAESAVALPACGPARTAFIRRQILANAAIGGDSCHNVTLSHLFATLTH